MAVNRRVYFAFFIQLQFDSLPPSLLVSRCVALFPRPTLSSCHSRSSCHVYRCARGVYEIWSSVSSSSLAGARCSATFVFLCVCMRCALCKQIQWKSPLTHAHTTKTSGSRVKRRMQEKCHRRHWIWCTSFGLSAVCVCDDDNAVKCTTKGPEALNTEYTSLTCRALNRERKSRRSSNSKKN